MNKGKQPNATCIISKNVRIRYPNSFRVGEYSIIDDFCYFSSAIKVGRCSHIASGCSIAGGPLEDFQLGDYCSLSSGVKICRFEILLSFFSRFLWCTWYFENPPG